MKELKVFLGLITVFITIPIWYYLLYKILIAVDATDLMFFLYWVYLPFNLFAHAIQKLIENVK